MAERCHSTQAVGCNGESAGMPCATQRTLFVATLVYLSIVQAQLKVHDLVRVAAKFPSQLLDEQVVVTPVRRTAALWRIAV